MGVLPTDMACIWSVAEIQRLFLMITYDYHNTPCHYHPPLLGTLQWDGSSTRTTTGFESSYLMILVRRYWDFIVTLGFGLKISITPRDSIHWPWKGYTWLHASWRWPCPSCLSSSAYLEIRDRKHLLAWSISATISNQVNVHIKLHETTKYQIYPHISVGRAVDYRTNTTLTPTGASAAYLHVDWNTTYRLLLDSIYQPLTQDCWSLLYSRGPLTYPYHQISDTPYFQRWRWRSACKRYSDHHTQNRPPHQPQCGGIERICMFPGTIITIKERFSKFLD